MTTFKSDVFEAESSGERKSFGGMKAAGTAKSQRKLRAVGKSAAASAQPRPAGSPLTARQIALLRHSFARVEKKAGIAALMFYRHLFTLDPSLRKLFHTDIELQARKLMEALGFVIKSLEKPAELTPALEALGRRHSTYGVREEHYATVVSALLATLEESLAGAFQHEDAVAWKRALEQVAGIMKRSGASLSALPQPKGGGCKPALGKRPQP